MEFRLLGTLEVCDADGRPIDAGRPMQRALLAMLLLEAGRVVPVASIVDGLWGDDPPPSADNSIQGYVSRLRKALAPDAPIDRAGPGYRLTVAPDTIDIVRFERLAAEARSALSRGEATAAAAALDRALALHRGPPLGEFVGPAFRGRSRAPDRADGSSRRRGSRRRSTCTRAARRSVAADRTTRRGGSVERTPLGSTHDRALPVWSTGRRDRGLSTRAPGAGRCARSRTRSRVAPDRSRGARAVAPGGSSPPPRGRDFPAHRCRRFCAHVGARARRNGTRDRASR